VFSHSNPADPRRQPGSESTAFAIATTFWQLLHHPAALERLTAEVRAAFSSVADIRLGPTLDSCSYLRACIDETMRVFPPIPNYLPRHVQPGGLTVDDQYLPKTTQVGVVQYTLNRNPHYFPDPDTWRPERWIPDASQGTTEASVQAARKAFFPFSAGPRVCLGQTIAEMEMRTVFARALWTYDVRLAPGAECCGKAAAAGRRACEPGMTAHIAAMLPGGGPMAQFRKRDDLAV
jgi:cytochrome P450